MESNKYLIAKPSSHLESSQSLEQYRKQAEREEEARDYNREIQNSRTLRYDYQEKDKFLELHNEIQNMREKNRSLYIVANRGPVQYKLTKGQKFKIKFGAGGVSSALNSLKEYDVPVDKWFSSPMSKGDRKVMNRQLSDHYHFVPLAKEIYHNYYNKISNNLLWFVLHEMDNHHVSEIEQGWKSYTRANQVFADTVHAEIERNAEKEPIVMIHDYHFLRLPGMLREHHPTIILQHFIHVPWPKPEVWQALPTSIVKDIYYGMSKNNIIGFQTDEDAENFLKGAQDYLPNAKIDFETKTVHRQEHDTQVRAYPISISVKQVSKTSRKQFEKNKSNKRLLGLIREIEKVNLSSIFYKPSIDNARLKKGKEVQEEERKDILGSLEKVQKILRVDRIEPTKNILAGFQAYGLMLEKYPELREKVVFRCRLVPCRQEVPLYQDLAKQIKSKIKEINHKYGNKNWKPIDAFFGHDYPGALAEMVSYDVLLVNPIKDGMNLVAKEGVVVNQNDGVLILSQTAGAFHELKDWALPLASPDNVEETAEALKDALMMPLEERQRRATMMRETVERNDLVLWLSRQLHDINAIPPQSSREERMKVIASSQQPLLGSLDIQNAFS